MNKQNVAYAYNEILLSHKRNELHLQQDDLKNIMLSERSQTQKVTYGVLPCIWNIQYKQIHTDSRSKGAMG